jgi:hypothetical protein
MDFRLPHACSGNPMQNSRKITFSKIREFLLQAKAQILLTYGINLNNC